MVPPCKQVSTCMTDQLASLSMAELAGIFGCGFGLIALAIGWGILRSLQTNVRELRMEVDQLHRWSQRLLMSSLNAGRYAPSVPSEQSAGLRISEITEIARVRETAPSIAPLARWSAD
jgi:hypothetical protein